ncbi:serum amyloid P-component [Ictalurus furcatus]|uniref:serum amyloid P-component n=1 Tax=Ictalurus furcatus TaxID=66913 RepID=UPI002350F962|nr:serum amyloid P-component [Ictalurus furcatus]
MKRLVVLFFLFLLAASERQTLSGKMFTFPVESNRHHVSLTPELNNSNFTALTVCLRAFSDLSQNQSLFSLAFPSQENAFVIFKPKQGTYRLHVGAPYVEFLGMPDDPNVWNSVCATWEGKTGVAQLWVNGNPSTRKGFSRGGSLSGAPSIILGQERSKAGFVASRSFVGMLTDVHMWDSVLPLEQLAYYTYGRQFQPGNVLNWNSLEFSKTGYVLLECTKTTQKLN